MTRPRLRLRLVLCGLAMALAGCEGVELPFGGGRTAGATEAAQPETEVRIVERDVEAPEVFQVSEAGLWDGRPSLGGVWVAYPEVTDPERVIIRNEENGRFVIGALFRREREDAGPRLQVSSDAADALGMVPGQTALMSVTALRREEVPAAPPAIETPGEDTAGVAAAAAAAIAEAEDDTAAAPPPAAAVPPPAQATTLAKPYIQIGYFSVKRNADRTMDNLRARGILPSVRENESNDTTYWRVIVGPARDEDERDALLATVRDMGFSDAYFVTD